MFCLKRKSALAGMEQKFSCLRLARNSQIQRRRQMRTFILGGLLASVMLVPALAQTSPPPAPPAPAAQSTAPKAHAGEMWRSSKLIGLSIYNDQNEKLGDISEILLDKSGKADFVVIGVGGFLGIGQQDIMVEMSKLKFVDEPVRTSSTTTSTTGSAATGTANRPAPATTTMTPTTKSKWYPDHAVLSGATKDSLKNMAEFKYD
jgi:sporulation protein YlmC with PRC-barrel domain